MGVSIHEIGMIKVDGFAEFPLHGNYSVFYFAGMHKYIFQDICDWAGEFRKYRNGQEE